MTFHSLQKTIFEQIDTLDRYLDLHRTYGLSAARIDRGLIAETLAVGKAIQSNTLFQAASISKSIFAATLMKLEEAGLLDLAVNLVPAIERALETTLPNGTTITYTDLLSHTAGFNVPGFCGYHPYQSVPNAKQILLGVRPANNPRIALIHPPKTIFAYSGGGYQLAQFLMEEATGKGFEPWAKELVFDPLGMRCSTFSVPQRSERCIGWSCHDAELLHEYVRYPETAAAGLWTTPMELAMFGIEVMNALKGDSLWLTKQSADAMLALPEGIETSYAQGFRVETIEGSRWFGHGGDNFGFHARMLFCPETGDGIVVMVNSDIGDFIPNVWCETFAKHGRKETT